MNDEAYRGGWAAESATHFQEMVAQGAMSPKEAERGLADEMEVIRRDETFMENYEKACRDRSAADGREGWMWVIGGLAIFSLLVYVLMLLFG